MIPGRRLSLRLFAVDLNRGKCTASSMACLRGTQVLGSRVKARRPAETSAVRRYRKYGIRCGSVSAVKTWISDGIGDATFFTAERKRRCCVIGQDEELRTNHTEAHFNDVPHVHPFRQPSYLTQQLHTLSFAKNHNARIRWVLAHEVLTNEA